MNNNFYCQLFLADRKDSPLIHSQTGVTLSYHDIDTMVGRYCNRFRELGLKSGERLIQKAEKCLDAWLIYLAALRYGLVYIPLNPAYKYHELAYFIKDAQPTLFVCSPDQRLMLERLIESLELSTHIETISKNGDGSIQTQIMQQSSIFPIHPCSSNDIAAILYTSGTTGQPKGAMLSHSNLLANGEALVECWGFSADDHLLHLLPIFHCHGLFFACHCVMLSGASMTMLEKFDVEKTLIHLPYHNVMMGVPTYYTRLLADKRFNRALTHHVRLFISGSAPLSESTFNAFFKRTRHTILERYGMTETGINTSNSLHGKRIAGTVGRPLKNVEIRLVNNQNQPVGVNQVGNLQIKSPSLFRGYWCKPDVTESVFTPEGYFNTGDIAIMDKNQVVKLLGRRSDMIISGGINIYPKEIENIINNLEAVEESAVVGLPHPDLGEAVTAFIVINPYQKLSKQSILTTIKYQIANYKAPKKILFVDCLPTNSMGKIQKYLLRDRYRQLYINTQIDNAMQSLSSSQLGRTLN